MLPSPLAGAAGPPEKNLVLRAEPLAWELEKLVPAGAGLGGGSADAAAALLLLNDLGNLGLSADQLETLASELGSDVAFCVRGGCALGRGRGNLLERLPSRRRDEVVLAWPGEGISTAAAYAAIAPEGPADAGLLARLRAAVANQKAPFPPDLLSNSFYNPALPNYSAVRRVAELLSLGGAAHVRLSGSGSAVFALFDSASEADQAAERAAAAGGDSVWIARTRLTDRGVERLG
jgi:4-diphosphocytidyl-2-C-methyl-D-erythritol kinase